jgi:hypothetical protein
MKTIHALGTVSTPRGKEGDGEKRYHLGEQDHVMYIQFSSAVNPSPALPAPVRVEHASPELEENADRRHRLTGVSFLSNPSYGAYMSAEAATADGRDLMTVYISCEPVTYVIYIPWPTDAELSEWKPDSSWSNVLMDLPSPFPEDWKNFKYPDEMRPEVPKLCQLAKSDPDGRMLATWYEFHFATLFAAAYRTLYVGKQRQPDDIFAVEIARRSDRKARTHFAFTHRIVSSSSVPRSKIAEWALNLSTPVSAENATDLSDIVDRMLSKNSGKGDLNPVLVVLPSDAPGRVTRWKGHWEAFGDPPSRKAWASRIKADEFLATFVERGYWLGPENFRKIGSPDVFNAWGSKIDVVLSDREIIAA